jgi:hypothetical protein
MRLENSDQYLGLEPVTVTVLNTHRMIRMCENCRFTEDMRLDGI